MQGAGTQSNPYLVSTPQDLDLIRNNLSAYYKLTNDIDMSTFGNFLTIGRISPYFSGTIDGNGCKISNLSIVESGSMIAFVGLLNAGKIMNLYLENIYVESNLNSVGGIVGKNFNGTITNCSVTGTIKQTDTTRFYTGGFVAESENGVIENCFADCNVSGGRYLGGFIGYAVGEKNRITNCYSRSTVLGVSNVGGFHGYGNTTSGYIPVFSSNYFDYEIAGTTNNQTTGVYAKTTVEMKNQLTYTNWDFTNTWAINSDYPILRVFGLPIVANKKTILVNSYLTRIETNHTNHKKSFKELHTHLNQFITASERHIATKRFVEGYLSNIETTATRNARTVRSSIANVTSYISTIGSYVNRQSKTVKNLLSHIKPIQSDINVLVPLNMNIPNAYVSTLESINKPFKIENMTQVSYILNPSHVEVRK